MKWSIPELDRHQDKPIDFETVYDLEEEIKSRDREVLALSKINVQGTLLAKKEEYLLSYTANFTITLPSSRSLEPVEVNQTLQVEEVFMRKEIFEQLRPEEQHDTILFIEAQTISLTESVADNILLNIPSKVLTQVEMASEKMPEGAHWQVISEEDYAKKTHETTEENNPFAQLQGMFEEEK